MQDLSSLITRDQTCAPCIGWTAGGALVVTLFSRMILTVGLIGSEHVGVCGQGDGAGGPPLPGGRSWVPASGDLGTTVKLDAVGKPRTGGFWFQGLGGGL